MAQAMPQDCALPIEGAQGYGAPQGVRRPFATGCHKNDGEDFEWLSAFHVVILLWYRRLPWRRRR